MRQMLVGLIAMLLIILPLLVPAPDLPARAQGPGMTRSSSALCSPFPPPTGPIVTVSTEAELRDQARNAAPGTTILVAPGTYYLQDAVWVTHDSIAIRGATGDRDDVVLDGGGMLTWTNTHVIAIDADDVTVADLTIRNGDEHGISVQGRDRPVLYNLHIVDTGYQLVKVNLLGDGSDDGLLACSRLEYTTTSPEDYTNGISAHNAHRWTVRDNQWIRIRTPGNAPVPAILFWSGSSDTVVERNLLVDCYQGIAFGNASHGPGDHIGGVVRNNVIYASLPHDVVVEMVHATDWLVAHNTALLLNPDAGLTWGMEARFADTSGTFAYNLTNMDIRLNRDGANATGTGNVVNAQSDWFADPAGADLHLTNAATAAIDQAAALAQVTDDLDGDARPIGPAPDIGADEFRSQTQTSIPLAAGWNLVSVPVVPHSTAITDVLASIAGRYAIVHTWDAAAQGWRTYNPALPPEASMLHSLDEKTAFWILLTEAATLTVDGTPPATTDQTLFAGWNLVAYPFATARPVAEALASIAGKYTVVWAYYADEPQPWKHYSPAAPFGNDLAEMEPGRGYWVRATEACTLVIP
ncbi:MAG: right-handed parallel beta-helix repeat-containing protein [Chloroflexi bacterium]|nr:right-handed parallel beta-helix repeat-containing protein [Chloroflexota bacterium]